jgi:hypothetical protein
MNRIIVTAALVLGSLASPSASPGQAGPGKKSQVVITVMWADTTRDLWEELRQVDPSFKALGEEVARIAKGLEADEIETRSKASADLKALGLTAYGHIKELREKAAFPALRKELELVLAAMAGETEKPLATLPGARRIGAKESEALRARLKEKKIPTQAPNLALLDGQTGNIFVGDSRHTDHKVRVITIEGNGTGARLQEQGPLMKTGIMIQITPKVDAAKGTTTLEIVATSRGAVGADTTEVTAKLAPVLGAKEGFLAGPFPFPEEKGSPWWIYVDCLVIP